MDLAGRKADKRAGARGEAKAAMGFRSIHTLRGVSAEESNPQLQQRLATGSRVTGDGPKRVGEMEGWETASPQKAPSRCRACQDQSVRPVGHVRQSCSKSGIFV